MCCPKFYNSIIKYGKDNFKASILEICDLDELNAKETYYIRKYNTVDDGYNILYSNGNNIKKYRRGDSFTCCRPKNMRWH